MSLGGERGNRCRIVICCAPKLLRFDLPWGGCVDIYAEPCKADMTDAEYKCRIQFLRNLTPFELLQELLAIIHSDGGNYVAQYGPSKAVLDAELKWYEASSALQSRDAPTSDSLSGG